MPTAEHSPEFAAGPDFAGRIYARLEKRNRLVAILRIGVPIFGLIVLFGLVIQIILANMGGAFQLRGLRLEHGALVVDAPEYSGRMADGTRYMIEALEAESLLTDPDEIALNDAAITFVRADNYLLKLHAADAMLTVGAQILDVPALLRVTDSTGLEADLYRAQIDLNAQTMDVQEHAVVRFTDGTVLNADTLLYNAKAKTWAFEGAKMVIPMAEEAQ